MNPEHGSRQDPDTGRNNTLDEQRERQRIVYWSAGLMTLVVLFGLTFWSEAGVAVYFEKISASFAGCF